MKLSRWRPTYYSSLFLAVFAAASHQETSAYQSNQCIPHVFGVANLGGTISFVTNTGAFTASGISAGCKDVTPPTVNCTFCVSWQLAKSLGGNVWQVQAPYPVNSTTGMACNTTTTTGVQTHTTAALGPGTYEMSFYMTPGTCRLGSGPTVYQSMEFIIPAP